LLIKSKNTETYLSTVFLAAQINIFLIIDVHSSILHFSFFILHLKLGEPLRGAHSVLTHLCLRRLRRAIRSITFAGAPASVVPLLSLSLPRLRRGYRPAGAFDVGRRKKRKTSF